MQQYFINDFVGEDEIAISDKDMVNHMFNVMRLSTGDELILVDQSGVKYLAELSDAKSHIFRIKKAIDENLELPIRVSIASGFPKGDKMSFISQKATELGAYEIFGFPADRSVVKWNDAKLDKLMVKLQKIVKGAAEQSKRNHVPELKLFKRKNDLVEIFEKFDKVIIAYEESALGGENSVLSNVLNNIEPSQTILFVFGPEGGLSGSEIDLFTSKGGICAGLGPRIMRAETAPIYALSAVSYALELNS